MTYINSLAFVMLAADDVDRSAKFYQDALGLTLAGRFGDFAFFDTGSVTLVLTGELSKPSAAGPQGCEVVFGVDSVREAYDGLRDRIAFVNEPRRVNDRNWAVNFNDPDGHQLSLYGAE